MYCKECGSKNDDSAKFCFNCGAALEKAPIIEGYPLYGSGDEPDGFKERPPKKKKISKLPIILIVIVAIILAGAITVYAKLPDIKQAVMGDSVYYFYQEYNNISEILDAGSVSELRHPDTYSVHSQATASFSGEGSDIVNTVIKDSMITADVNYEKSSGTVVVDSSLLNGKEDVFGIGLDYLDGDLAFSTDLLKEGFMLYSKNAGANESIAQIADVKATDIVDLDALKSICKDIDQNNVTKGNGMWKNEKCTTVTFNFSGKELDNIFLQLLDIAMDSEVITDTVYDIIDEYFEFVEEDLTAKEFINEYLVDELKDGLFVYEFDDFEMVVYYNSKGKIVAREVTITDGKYKDSCVIATNIDKKNCDLSISVEGTDIVFSKTIEKGVLNANIEFSYDKDEIFSCELRDVQAISSNGVKTIGGTLDLNVEDYVTVKINSENDGSANIIDADISIYDGDIKLEIENTFSKKADVSGFKMPKNSSSNLGEYVDALLEAAEDILDSSYEDVIDAYYDSYYDDYYDYDDYFYDDYYDM